MNDTTKAQQDAARIARWNAGGSGLLYGPFIENRPVVDAAQDAGHRLALRILGCKNGKDRAMIRRDARTNPVLSVAADWLLIRGYVQVGATNASARAHTAQAELLLYLTKAGKAWLLTFGSDYGSGLMWMRMLRAANPAYATKVYGADQVAL